MVATTNLKDAATLGEAESLLEQGEFLRAIGAYQQILSTDAANIRALIGLAEATNYIGYRGDAQRLYRKVLGLDPQNSIASSALRFANDSNEILSDAEAATAFPAFSLPPQFNPEIRRFIDSKAAPNLSTLFCDNNLIRFQCALTFLGDAALVRATRNSSPDGSLTGIWRAHVLVWAARQALRLPGRGDLMELGVHAGFSAACVYDCLDLASTDRQFYLYDTFAGLGEFDPTDHTKEYFEVLQKNYRNPAHQERVVKKFSGSSNVHIVVGLVPDTLEQKAPDSVSYLHLDLNAAGPEIAALGFLWDRLVPGAYIILDDFGSLYQNQTKAHAAFFERKNLSVLELPTGQGLAIKI